MNAAMRAEAATRLRVRHELASVALVRNRLAADLRQRGLCAETVADAALVLSELVTNAIRHTSDHGALDVSWVVDPPELEVSVVDASSTPPRRRPIAPDAASGRGLRIVEAIAAAWGMELTGAGKRVWARLRLAPQH